MKSNLGINHSAVLLLSQSYHTLSYFLNCFLAFFTKGKHSMNLFLELNSLMTSPIQFKKILKYTVNRVYIMLI